MFVYTVKPGDSLGVLAIRYQTTIRILMEENPGIDFTRTLRAGQTIQVRTPGENRYEFIQIPLSQNHDVKETEENHFLKNYLLPLEKDKPGLFRGRTLKEGQIAFVRTLKRTYLIEIQANGLEKKLRLIRPGELLRVYDHATIRNRSYLIVDHYRFVLNDSSLFEYEEVPTEVREGKVDLKKRQSTQSTTFNHYLPYSLKHFSSPGEKLFSTVGYGPVPEQTIVSVPPSSFVGTGDPLTQSSGRGGIDSSFYQSIDYARPLLVMRDANGNSKRVELRVLGSSVSYNNSVQPVATNAGWMVNIGPTQLPTINISGYLLETELNQEFITFTDEYKRLLQAKKKDDFYALGLSTLFYKRSEYQGIVVSFNHSEQSEAKHNRRYQFQMIILKEKSLSRSQVDNISRPVAGSRGTTSNYRSNVASNLLNVITGERDQF